MVRKRAWRRPVEVLLVLLTLQSRYGAADLLVNVARAGTQPDASPGYLLLQQLGFVRELGFRARCRGCGVAGHNLRTCTTLLPTAIGQSIPPLGPTVQRYLARREDAGHGGAPP